MPTRAWIPGGQDSREIIPGPINAVDCVNPNRGRRAMAWSCRYPAFAFGSPGICGAHHPFSSDSSFLLQNSNPHMRKLGSQSRSCQSAIGDARPGLESLFCSQRGVGIFHGTGKNERWAVGGRGKSALRMAYISPPAHPSFLSESDSEVDAAETERMLAGHSPEPVITWAVVSRLLMKEKIHIVGAVLGLSIATTCTLTMPLFSGRFFETLIGARPEPLGKLLAKLGAIYVMEPVFTILFVTSMITVWEKVMANLRSEIFRRLLIQKIGFFDRHKVGELTGLLSSELGALKDIVNENVSRDRGFRAACEMLGTLFILFYLSNQLAPVLGLLMLTISATVAIYKRTTMPVFKAHGIALARISDCASETFAAIRTVRSFGGERRQMWMFDKEVSAYQKSGNKLGLLRSANESWTRIAVYVSLMALYILGGQKVKAGELAIGKMVSFIGYTFTLTFAVQGLVNTLADLRAMFAAVERINSIVSGTEVDISLARGLDREGRGQEPDGTLQSSADPVTSDGDANGSTGNSRHVYHSTRTVCELAWSGDVVLEDVHFSYPLRPDVEVLRGITLQLKRATVTAIVGSSGAGKSTIVQLLARFYEPSRGRITLAGEDVRLFDKIEWTRAISIVNQEPVLFALSVAENIAYGLPNQDVSQDDIVAAAKAANAHDFITALPQGYSTLVGERGSLLSGGQRQRIAIARALLKNAPILILDEATSALDTVSERLVQDALDRLMKGRTTLVIAHRLSTIQVADQIAVCADGKVVELGSHLQLLLKGGSYASLVSGQTVNVD